MVTEKITKYSVIIPTLNEKVIIKKVLTDLNLLRENLPYSVDIIISDGGSTDGTIEICNNFDVLLINSDEGRGKQLSSGAKLQKGMYWCFCTQM